MDTDDIGKKLDAFANATLDTVATHRASLTRIEERLESIENGASQLAAESTGRRIEPDPIGGGTVSRGEILGSPARGTGHGGFKHAGEFYAAVRSAGLQGSGEVDGRLMAAAATTFGNESSGTDGGFAVPPDFRTTIMEKVFGEDSLLARTMRIPVSGNSLTVPTSMTTPWSTTGIQAFWEAEAATITQSKPEIQETTVKLHKLAALVPVTDALLEDAPAMGALVSREAGEKIDYKLSDAIAFGNGVGMPLGFMNSGVLVTQAKEAGQSADTIVAGNVVKMASRLPVQSRTRAVWLIHPDAEHQLPLMTIGDQPIFMPPGGFRDTPFGRLLGRPVIPHQICKSLGDLGDVMLVDLNSYMTAVKSGGLRADTSIHLWFDQSLTAFRFVVRIAGQPWWSETTTAANGTFTQSPFVTLAARA